MKVLEGKLVATKGKFAIVGARFNEFIGSKLISGAEDTLVPSILNLASIWVVRLGLAFLLVVPLGLHGVWAAMAAELCVRGLLLLMRQRRSKYYSGSMHRQIHAVE